MLQLLFAYITGSLIFLAYYLIIKKDCENKLGNFWLILFFMALISAFIAGSLREFKLHLIYPHLYKFSDLNSFTIAPALFLAIKYFTTPLNRIKKTDWLHFIPTLVYIGFNIKYLFYGPENLAEIIQSPPRNKELFQILEVTLILQCFIYLILGLLKLIKYQKTNKLYDASNKIDLIWLKYFLYGMSVMLLFWILNLRGYLGDYIYIGYSFCIYYLGYFIINQKEIFPYSETNKKELISLILEDGNSAVVKTQVLNIETLEQEKEKLIFIMLHSKPYLDSELNLVKLAQMQGMGIRELSYLINQGFGENFNQYINKYRIEESKRLLSDPNFAHLNMVGIAYQSGFNSKTIFNTTFKKITGETPSEFRKNHQKDVRNHNSEQL